jgi:glutamyl-Q tRNA(Asp) synthetase
MESYRGRFAPSPTGDLHLGSLYAAVASYLDAKANQGQWLIRIEDIDPLREQPSAGQRQIETLAKHGLVSDETIIFQSQRSDLYTRQLSLLTRHHRTFLCPCSRKQIADSGHIKTYCPASIHSNLPSAVRYLPDPHAYDADWLDLIQGKQDTSECQKNEAFVLRRKEGFYSYQLAVVCDDIDQQITHIVRGVDLLDSTAGQRQLYADFGLSPPCYAHIPILCTPQGQKLSKQNKAMPLDIRQSSENLQQVLCMLNHSPPDNLSKAPVDELLFWAIENWDIHRLTNIPPQIISNRN